MKYLTPKHLWLLLVTLSLFFTSCNTSKKKLELSPEKEDLLNFDASKEFVYYNNKHVEQVKKEIKSNNPYFTEKYNELIKEGNALLNFKVDPVTNKTEVPPSKNMHDYISYAPYRWPDSSKLDGLPWVARDGIINPVSRGSDTDFSRKDAFFNAIDKLAWSYYFSDDIRYADKALALIKVWYLDKETKVNPNINFGQAHPGIAKGTKAGVHEWDGQSSIITALQMFEAKGVLPAAIKNGMTTWFSQYLNWLITEPMAIDAGFTRQNHANHYTYQVVGLMMYLNKIKDAKAVVEDAKMSRIADQIMPDGRQPRELGRTKSVSYSVTNIWLMTEITLMGQKIGVDLWKYETEDGRSLKKAYEFLAHYISNPEEWPEKQISKGGAEKAIENYMKPLFSKASTALGIKLIEPNIITEPKLKPLDVLKYPPTEKL